MIAQNPNATMAAYLDLENISIGAVSVERLGICIARLASRAGRSLTRPTA